MTAEDIVNGVYSIYVQAGGGPSALNFVLAEAANAGVSQDTMMQAFTTAYGGLAQSLGQQIAAASTTVAIGPALAAAAGVSAETITLANASAPPPPPTPVPVSAPPTFTGEPFIPTGPSDEAIVRAVYSDYVAQGGGPSALNYVLAVAQQAGVSQNRLMQAFTLAYGGAAQGIGRQIADSSTTLTISPALAAAAGVTAGTIRLANAPPLAPPVPPPPAPALPPPPPSAVTTDPAVTVATEAGNIYTVAGRGDAGFVAVARAASVANVSNARLIALWQTIPDYWRRVVEEARQHFGTGLAQEILVAAGQWDASRGLPMGPPPAPVVIPPPTPPPAPPPVIPGAALSNEAIVRTAYSAYIQAGGGPSALNYVLALAQNNGVSQNRLMQAFTLAYGGTAQDIWSQIAASATILTISPALAAAAGVTAGTVRLANAPPVAAPPSISIPGSVIPQTPPPPIPTPPAIIPRTRVAPGPLLPPHPTLTPEAIVGTAFGTFNNAGGGPVGAATVKALAETWGVTWDQVGQAFRTAFNGIAAGLWPLLNSSTPPARLEDPRQATVAGGLFGSPWVLGGMAALGMLMFRGKRRR